jgi:UDP-glucose 4-epimerase
MSDDALAGKRAVVTGGMGFIGSHLAAALLDRGAEVTIVDSLIPEYGGNPFNVRDIADRVDIQYTDIRDPWAIRRLVQDKDLIFNLAGQVSHIDSMTDPETDLEINGRAQLSLLEALRADNPEAKVIFAASRQQYGRPRELPVTEDHPMEPVDVNGINLVAAERFHLLYTDVHGIPTVSLRLTNTYGPHLLMKHDRQGFITTFIRRALDGEDIRVFGDGSQLRDFTYVDDAVEAFLAAAVTDDANGEAFNVGGLAAVPLIEVAELCQRIAGEGGDVETVPWPEERRRIDIGSVYLARGKIEAICGWAPRVELADGLERTIDFYRRHRDHYWS